MSHHQSGWLVSVMAVTVGVFDSLMWWHAVKMASAASGEECSLEISKMLGLWLHLINIKNEQCHHSFFLSYWGSKWVTWMRSSPGWLVRVYTSPFYCKKVKLSNVASFIKNKQPAGVLTWYGKLVSPVKKIPKGSKSLLLKNTLCLWDDMSLWFCLGIIWNSTDPLAFMLI